MFTVLSCTQNAPTTGDPSVDHSDVIKGLGQYIVFPETVISPEVKAPGVKVVAEGPKNNP
jgi:hypothetical protein